MNPSATESTSWIKRLSQAFSREPQNKDELIGWLRRVHQNTVIDVDTLNMLEGVIQFSQMRVRDIMIPRTQMVTISYHAALEDIFNIIHKSGHSRFPVIEDNKDE